MNYCVVKGKNKYIALAKKEPFTCENPDLIRETGELWFEFGNTPEQALDRLKESLTPLALDLRPQRRKMNKALRAQASKANR